MLKKMQSGIMKSQDTFRFLTIRLYVSSSCLFLCFLALSRAPSASAPTKEIRISRLRSPRIDKSNHQCYTATVPTRKQIVENIKENQRQCKFTSTTTRVAWNYNLKIKYSWWIPNEKSGLIINIDKN